MMKKQKCARLAADVEESKCLAVRRAHVKFSEDMGHRVAFPPSIGPSLPSVLRRNRGGVWR